MSALILGATSAIARQIALRYAQAGEPVYIAARDTQEAERIAADVAIRAGVATASGPFDALDFESHPALIERAEAELGPLTVLVVAFGEMGDQRHSERDFSAAQRVIDTNFTGAASLCEAAAQRMQGRKAGLIIGLSSVAGERGRQSNYFYGAAKGAFTLYLQGLRNRLFADRVHVLTVKLGFIDTPMTYGMKTGIPIADPAAAAEAIYQAGKRGENELYYPRFWGGIMGVIKGIPEHLFKRLSL